jgi:hypothetical protein
MHTSHAIADDTIVQYWRTLTSPSCLDLCNVVTDPYAITLTLNSPHKRLALAPCTNA